MIAGDDKEGSADPADPGQSCGNNSDTQVDTGWGLLTEEECKLDAGKERRRNDITQLQVNRVASKEEREVLQKTKQTTMECVEVA